MKLLFTGFDPFGGEDTNASFEAVKRLPDEIGGARIVKAQLPTEFDRGVRALLQLIETERPDAVICVGQAAGRAAVTPEKAAINYADARIPDNAGVKPEDAALIPGGETVYFATIPVRRIAESIVSQGIPASVSYSAGTFVCNCVMYHALRYAKKSGSSMQAGFIHVPLLPEQVKPGESLPSLPLDEIVRALKTAANEIVQACCPQ